MTTRPAVTTPASAREAAFTVLLRVEAADAFASILLYRTLERSGLGAADRNLATALVLGVLRHRERIHYALTRCLREPMANLPPAIRIVLQIGAFQILDLDRIPAPVAVSEAVTMARRHGHTGTARLVNAVLRRLAAEGAPAPPDRQADPIGHLSVVHSHPRWLLARWVARWGFDEARAQAEANTRPAPSTLRVNTLMMKPDAALAALRDRSLRAEPGVLPEAIRVDGSLVQRLPMIDEGLCIPQDEAAMLVSVAVAPPPGSVVIDACAAPGGKTTHLAALLQNHGRVLACDVHPRKLEALAHRAAAMGATCVEAHHLDAREIGRRWPEQADAVLVDAPCSGLGTIRRRPEIKWRASEGALARHAGLQQAILAGAAGAVRPCGALVYSVCSLEPEEGPQVVHAFLVAHPAFALAPFPPAFPRVVRARPVEDPVAGEVHLFPHRHDTDGFYIARLERR